MSAARPVPGNRAAGTGLRAGDLAHVTRAASVQFVRPIMFRVIRVLDRPTFDGWIWLDGYQLDANGDAVARREIFVQPAGLRVQRTAPGSGRRPAPAAPLRPAHGRL